MSEQEWELGLDPASWEDLRAHGHRALDELFDWMRDLREAPSWRAVPEAVRAELRAPLPAEGIGAEGAWAAFRRLVLPHVLGNVHPRFWGWVMGTGSPSGVLAEMATAAINVNAWGGQQAAAFVELQVLDWCKAMVGFPASASGTLVTGGSMANLVALAAARDRAAPEIPARGLGALPSRLVLYASSETHNSAEKAVRLLGLGGESFRAVPVDGDFRMDLSALGAMLAADRAAGARPFCVIGNAGTVNTGAVDDLEALADLCAREGLWLHVDGAFGALAQLSPGLRPLVRGMERADSIAFDLHKWLHVPYDAGCVLVRDAEAHRRTYASGAAYLAPLPRGTAAGPVNFSTVGPELSREFRGLKVWMLLQEHGVGHYAALVEQNVAQAAWLAERIREEPRLELMAPQVLQIVCVRYVGGAGPGGDGARLDAMNRELLMRMQERGIATPSQTVLRGRFALRVSITNHRTRRDDLEAFLEALLALGAEVEAAGAEALAVAG